MGLERDAHVRRRQQVPGLLRPFDQDHVASVEGFPESGVDPFSRVVKPIKIKVVQV